MGIIFQHIKERLMGNLEASFLLVEVEERVQNLPKDAELEATKSFLETVLEEFSSPQNAEVEDIFHMAAQRVRRSLVQERILKNKIFSIKVMVDGHEKFIPLVPTEEDRVQNRKMRARQALGREVVLRKKAMIPYHPSRKGQ